MSNPIADPLVELPDTSPTSDLVDLEATGTGAVTVTMNRPAGGNALNADLISALDEAFETLQGAEGVRVVFLRGAGGTFSAGADPEWMRAAADHTEADHREDAFAMAHMLKQLWDLPALTVALVDGEALGGGAGLAAACDLAIATRTSKFGFPEVRLGLIPATVSPYVVQAIGPRAARGLFASAQLIDADDALRIGLISEVAADATALDAARERIAAASLACAPEAVADAKRLVTDIQGHKIDHGLLMETAKRLAQVRVGEEGQEGVRAVLEGRPPSWASS